MAAVRTKARPTGRALDGWLRLAEAALLAGVGRTTLHHAAAAGEVPYAVVPGARLFRAEDVEAWASSRRTAT